MKQQEEELLMNEEESARQYLMSTVIPVLSQGLTELYRIQPNDPIDFLVGFRTVRRPCVSIYTPIHRVHRVSEYTAVCILYENIAFSSSVMFQAEYLLNNNPEME